MNSVRIALVSAGLSNPSSTRLLGERIADAAKAKIEETGSAVQIDLIELRPLAHSIANFVLTQVPDDDLKRAIDSIARADAVVAVTPTFAMSYSGLFKSFFDTLDVGALRSVPMAIAATGGSARHSMVLETALRPLFSYAGARIAPTGIFAASEDWGDDSGLDARIRRTGAELADLVRVLPRAARVDEFDPAGDGFADFGSMMKGLSR